LNVVVGEGQSLAYQRTDGAICVNCQNIGDLFFIRPVVKTAFELSAVEHYPIKNPSPSGYVVYNSVQPHGFQINVPPDGVVPIQIRPRRG
jgi:hypothetical protein